MLFKEVKKLFTKELVLKIYILSLLIKVKIDTLDYILGVYLVQLYLNGWHLVIYYSWKITLVKLNYNIYNKVLLGIVTVFKEWRAFLYNTTKLFKVITDYTSANCSRAKTLELLEPPGASWSLLAVLAGTWQEPSRNWAGLLGRFYIILTLEFLIGPRQDPDRTVSAVGSPPCPR